MLTYKEESMPANAATLDIERGKLDTLRLLPWQTDTSISIHSWGYVEHDEYRTAKSLIHQLLDTVSKNGNLLLNVGPKSDGTIPDEARTVLLQMGDWLKLNGEAIYASRPFYGLRRRPPRRNKEKPIAEKNSDIQTYTSEDIRFTTSRDGRILYATALGWPSPKLAGSLAHPHSLPRQSVSPRAGLPQSSSSARPAASPSAQQPDGLHLTLPTTSPGGDMAYVFRIETHCSASPRR